MKESRLIEITSMISKLDGPLAVLEYLVSLGSSDIYLFLNYVKGSNQDGLNIYDAAVSFSKKYLKSKNILVESPSFEKYDCHVSNYDQIVAFQQELMAGKVGVQRR